MLLVYQSLNHAWIFLQASSQFIMTSWDFFLYKKSSGNQINLCWVLDLKRVHVQMYFNAGLITEVLIHRHWTVLFISVFRIFGNFFILHAYFSPFYKDLQIPSRFCFIPGKYSYSYCGFLIFVGTNFPGFRKFFMFVDI